MPLPRVAARFCAVCPPPVCACLVTVTVHVFMDALAAVTVYVRGAEKFCATPERGLIEAPALTVIVGVSEARFAEEGMRTATVALTVSIVELPTCEGIVKVRMFLADDTTGLHAPEREN